MMFILLEQVEDFKNDVLEESTGSGAKDRKYFIEGICIQSEVVNANKRFYPKSLIKPVIDRYIVEKVEKNMAVGELNHPVSDPAINYERTSHKFLYLKEDGNNWRCRAVVTKNTPMGSIVAGLMDEGVVMGMSSRATGKVNLKKGVKMVEEFNLKTPGDIVSDPSAPDAYLTNLMENKEWVLANGVLVEQDLEEAKDEMNRMARTKTLTIENMTSLFNSVISRI